MKTHLLCLQLCMLMSFALFTQTNNYHSFPDTNSIWHHREQFSGSGSSHFQYGLLAGDTSINSLTWHKLYLQQNCLSDPVMTTANSILAGAVREDSLKRIFFYCINSGIMNTQADSVYKLYDFSASPGDTIQFGADPQYNSPYLALDSIDSVFTYNHFRKRFYLHGPGPSEVWIEGIGSTRSLFSVISPYPTCSCALDLFCFRQNDTTYYLKSPFIDCYDLTADIMQNEIPADALSLFPNPFISEARLEVKTPLENATLTIFNSFGVEVKEIKNMSGRSVILDGRDLAAGFYFIRVIGEKQTIATGKFLIAGK
jgi:hypothetical protein